MDRDKRARSFRIFGKAMGITGVSVARLCDQETMPTDRHRQLLELGVPVELLPRAEDGKPGRRPLLGLHDEFRAAYIGG